MPTILYTGSKSFLHSITFKVMGIWPSHITQFCAPPRNAFCLLAFLKYIYEQVAFVTFSWLLSEGEVFVLNNMVVQSRLWVIMKVGNKLQVFSPTHVIETQVILNNIIFLNNSKSKKSKWLVALWVTQPFMCSIILSLL